MANSKGSSNIRNNSYAGQQSLLPPRSPFPSVAPSYVDYGSTSATGSKGIANPRQGLRHHQRTSSESFLIEEQPSWVEELLNEPETPVRRGHRRSSSDSFAYLDAANFSNLDSIFQDDYKFKNIPSSTRGSQDFDYYKDVRHASFYPELNSYAKKQDRTWDSSFSSMSFPNSLQSACGNLILPSSGFSCPPQEPTEVPSSHAEKQDHENTVSHDPRGSFDRRDSSHKPSASETDPKRAKQQFAQRSRVRKLQYIAELERNVQALQAEGSEVSAEIEFLDRQNLILNLENKALKQRLDGLTQEQAIKCLEQEVLEREITRLRVLFQHQQQQQLQQQQQQQQRPHPHRRSNSRDLDSQFANLSLKQEASSSHDPVSGQLQI